MYKRLIIVSLLFVAATAFTIYALASHQPTGQPNNNDQQPTANSLILYYGDGCPHCKIVEDYLAANPATKQLKIISKEVYSNPDNANELVNHATTCGLDTADIGVPFLWTGQNCLIGDQPIIDFLKDKTNNQ